MVGSALGRATGAGGGQSTFISGAVEVLGGCGVDRATAVHYVQPVHAYEEQGMKNKEVLCKMHFSRRPGALCVTFHPKVVGVLRRQSREICHNSLFHVPNGITPICSSPIFLTAPSVRPEAPCVGVASRFAPPTPTSAMQLSILAASSWQGEVPRCWGAR